VLRKRYEINVWGTVLFLDLGSASINEGSMDAAVEIVKSFVYEVDEVFSTYKSLSFVSRLRCGEIDIAQCPGDLQEIWRLCAVARDLTGGAFDPWAVAGGFDPSGYVKGWAADRVALILLNAGCEQIQVNAAGDLTLRGGVVEKGMAGPWKIGVVNPDNRQEVLRIFEITDGAIATSGTYERGAHIFDPHTGTIAIGAKSATVLGPDGGLTDALATALMVSGEDGAGWFAQPELAEYSAWVIDRHSGGAWGIGPAIS
jgi:thiamine biosynthesis lipoprotein